jgi:hypothetical protein
MTVLSHSLARIVENGRYTKQGPIAGHGRKGNRAALGNR